ncbi:nuclease [Nocardioides sp. Root190]|uniref:nuclease-related domain-containing DEAD/DEAH box helicase n=1 Tax=Nocardioides sp. Root190 TaxID=1736488 RepID=UPI0006FA1753|nr:nuclease-related domain-containing DEAD/DEAH box helicase [Nocardioides sp. Root190]KRB77984.1 nuclease [Nocardioides sp. Root190]
MVTCLPESPTFTTASEHEVWTLLRDQLGPDDVLIANQHLTSEERDYEADLVVLMPGFGVLVLEVKGSSVWYDDGWIQTRGGEAHWIDPVAQARAVKYALRTYVEQQAAWGSRKRVRWAHGVVTPYSSFDADFSVPELPRHALHDRDDLEHLVTRLRQNASKGDSQRPPDADDVEAVAAALTARFNTSHHDVNAEAAERAAEADRLTDQQSLILSVTRLVNRVEVRGGAGSGKTVLALQQAKELQRGGQDRKPQRVALLCYSIGLASYLKRQVATWPRKHQPSFVGTFHEFGKQWGAPDGDRADSDFWEESLPTLMGELADGLTDGKRYDAVVVDEAQDFAVSWWTPVLKALRDEEEGGLYVFSDENQRIFGRFGVPPVSLVPLVLDHCLRNTKQIHSAFAPLAPSRMYSRGGSGPSVRFIACDAGEAEEVADDEVARLLDDEGWEPGRVGLITTGHRHSTHKLQTEQAGQDAYWETFWDADEVFYGHVLGCKGLERAAVVLCLNEESVTDRARERLYVGMSRATDELVVVGDPEWVREVGGTEVAKTLGL